MHFSIILVLCVVIHSNSEDPVPDDEAVAKKEFMTLMKNTASSVFNCVGNRSTSGELQEDVTARQKVTAMLKSAPLSTYNYLADYLLRPVGQRIVEELPATWVEIANEKAAIASTYVPFISKYPLKKRLEMYKDLTKSLGMFAYKQVPLIDHTTIEEREMKAQRMLEMFTEALSTFYVLPVVPKFSSVPLKTIMRSLPNAPKQTCVMDNACYLCIIVKILEMKEEVIVNDEVQKELIAANVEDYKKTLIQMFKFINDQTRRSIFPSILSLYNAFINYNNMINILICQLYDNELKSAFDNVITVMETYMTDTLSLNLNYTFFKGVYSSIKYILNQNDLASIPIELKNFLNICPHLFKMFIVDRYVLEDFMFRLANSKHLTKDNYPDIIRFSLNYPFIEHNALYNPIYSGSIGYMGVFFQDYTINRGDMGSVMMGHFYNVLCTFSDFLDIITSVTSLKGKKLTENEYLKLIFQEFVEINEWNNAFKSYAGFINGVDGAMDRYANTFAYFVFRFKSYLRFFITEFNDFDKLINDSTMRYNIATIFESYTNYFIKHMFFPNKVFMKYADNYKDLNYDVKKHCKEFPSISINFHTFTVTDGKNLNVTIEDKINNISLRRLSSQFFLKNSLQFNDFVKDTRIFNVLNPQTSTLDSLYPEIFKK